MGVEGGFGDIRNCDGTGFNLNFKDVHLRRLPIYPLFMRNIENPPFSFSNLREQAQCLCTRWDPDRLPILPEGEKNSRFVFISSGPLSEDFEEGKIFSAKYPAGAVFSGYLELLGLHREHLYLTSALYCRTILNTDSAESLKACMRFKREEFEHLTQAEYYFTFGSAAFQMMSGIFGSASSFLGDYFKFELFGRDSYLIPFPHPAFSISAPKMNDRILEVMSGLGGNSNKLEG
jgi:uracil-DNA glycosylase family 4